MQNAHVIPPFTAGKGRALAGMSGSISDSENPVFMVLRFRE